MADNPADPADPAGRGSTASSGLPRQWARTRRFTLGAPRSFTIAADGSYQGHRADFTDGTSNTILVVEAKEAVPWTKPEDLPLDMSLPLTGLGSHHGYHNNGFNALFADGSVRFLKSSINPSVLGALVTRNGNETVSSEDY